MRTLRTALLFVFALATLYAHGQQDSLHIRFIGTDTLPPQQKTTTPQFTCSFEGSKIVQQTNRAWSKDGKICAVSGLTKKYLGLLPRPTQLEIYNNEKLVFASYDEYVQFEAAISPDGYTAAIGQLKTSEPNVLHLTIYSPKGKMLNRILLGVSDIPQASKIQVSLGGNYIAFMKHYNANNLLVYDKSGEKKLDESGFTLMSIYSFMYNTNCILTSDYMYNLETKQKINIPVVFTKSIADYEKNRIIFLSEEQGLTDVHYSYYFTILNIETGQVLVKEYKILVHFTENSYLTKLTFDKNSKLVLTSKTVNYVFELK